MAAGAAGAVAATMTDGGPSDPRRRPGPAGLMLASLGAFFALLAILAVQVRAGGDPALGPAKPAAEVAQRRVIVHRVVLRRVVVTEAAPRSSAPAGNASAGTAAPSAPAPSAPAPAPAAPAPAPAPVTTGSS